MSEMPGEYRDDELLEDVRIDIKEPALWKVVLLNDDYTPRDFVVAVLVSIFHKPPVEASQIMLNVHNTGRGIVGVYPYDIGKTKIDQTMALARDNEFPLKGILEEA